MQKAGAGFSGLSGAYVLAGLKIVSSHSYFSEKCYSAKEEVTAMSKTIRTRIHIESLQAQASQFLNSALRTQHFRAGLRTMNSALPRSTQTS